jgi:hypothetical protein
LPHSAQYLGEGAQHVGEVGRIGGSGGCQDHQHRRQGHACQAGDRDQRPLLEIHRDVLSALGVRQSIRRPAAGEGRLVVERLRLTPGDRVVLVVDRLEELFTLCRDERRRHRFVDALAALARRAVVLPLYGLRADFYGFCADFPHLRDALSERQVIVSAMTDDEVRQAVTLPAEGSGLSPATGLVDIILRDLRGATGHGGGTYQAELLPRLAHALRVMWLNRESDTLTVAGYHASGGIDGAIASTAEEEFASLTTESARNAARLLFLGLVRIGDHGEVSRRRRAREELVRDAPDPQAVEDVLDRFTRARLLTRGAARDLGPVTVEVNPADHSVGRG